jgi:NAD(P)H-nitrite reductase large subunit
MSTFEVKEETTSLERLWKCVVCGEEFHGYNPPKICPACGAVSNQFSEVSEVEVTFNSHKKEKFLIIGNGAAGYYAAGAIRKRNTQCEIEIISEESHLTYYRPSISDAISEDLKEASFYLSPKEWYVDNNITLSLGFHVEWLNPEKKQVILNDGRAIDYDKLILANGSKNFMIPVEGIEKSGVFTLRNLTDLEAIKNKMKTSKNVLIVGGGLLGLEAAYEMSKSGLHISVVDYNASLLSKQLDSESSRLLKAAVENQSISVILGDSVNRINGKTAVDSVTLKSGKIIEVDLVLFSTGIAPNINIADKTNLMTNKGILVNENMETNIPDIYACGDIAEFKGRVYGNWPVAVAMGKNAGTNAVGHKAGLALPLSVVSFNSMGLTLLTVGEIPKEPFKTITFKDKENKIYKKLFFSGDILACGILIGDTKSSAKLISAIKAAKSLKEVLQEEILL